MIEEGDIVLCTVDRIAGTLVFVQIEGEQKEGSIVLSEIAPGRIRNLRDYVVPKKKIVCKVLRTEGGTINLSLRRVTQKEKKEVLEAHNQEKGYVSILKSVMKEKAKEAIDKITKEGKLYDFFESVRENPKELEKVIGKENSQQIMKIILEQKIKKRIIKKTISLKTQNSRGIYLLKEILGDSKDIEIKYLSAGKYSLKIETEDGKQGEIQMKTFIEELEKKAKSKGAELELKDK